MINLADGLQSLQDSIKPPREVVSLDTLKKKEKEKIMAAFKRGRESAEDFYKGSVEPGLIKRKKIYDAPKEFYRKKFPNLSELSDWISRDVKTTIDWMLPSIMEVFIGTDDPCDIQGQNLDDDVAAKKLQSVVKYQINKKNDYFRFLYSFIKEGLITNLGVAKVYWSRDETRTEMKVMVDSSNIEQFLQLAQMGQIEIKEMLIIEGIGGIIKYDDIQVHFNAPVIENMSPSELRFTPDGTSLQSSKFVAQRKIVKGDYLKRKEQEGLFQDVDKAIRAADDTSRTGYEQYTNKHIDSYARNLSDDDLASKDVELYEAYLNVDYNNDGILEKVIVHAVGDTPISIQENTFRSIPFFTFSPEPDPYTAFGESSYADTLEQLQDLKTALIRQVLVAVGKNNRPQRFVAEQNVDLNALVDGDEIIPVRDGNPAESVMISPHIPIDPSTMTLVQYAQNEIESQSGSTRYNQGLDSNSLNKMLDIETPVPMADGSYKLLKDIVDGDRIIGRNGKPTTVLKAHKIHYPERAYNMTFASGEVICAGGEHLWTITTQHGATKTLDTDSLYEYICNTKANLYIPRATCIDFESKQKLPLDPYLLGVYLGDGHRHTCRITTPDNEIIEYIEAWCKSHSNNIAPAKTGQNSGLATTYSITGGLWSILREMKILQYKNDEKTVKHIPEEYFHASYKDRLELLRGLMDTDGCHHSGALCVFSQKEGRLLEDVFRLIRSLGMWPTRHLVDPGEKFAKDDVSYYNLHFSAIVNPFKISRKADKWKPRTRCHDKQKIVSIEPTQIRLMRCLTVDAEDGLFCVGECFTVTHNTASGIASIMGAADKKMKLLARIFAECAWVPIIKHIIKLDQQFLDPYQQFRLNDEMVSISPQELDIDYDLVVNTGAGAATKEAQMNYLIMIMQQLYPSLQQMGVVVEKSWYETAKDLLEKMGIRNVQNYLVDPDSDAWKQAQQQKAQAAQEAEQKALDTQLMLQKVKLESELQRQSIPRMTLNYKDLPVEAKQTAVYQYLKDRVPEADIWVKELMELGVTKNAERNTALQNGAGQSKYPESQYGKRGQQNAGNPQ